MKRIIVLILLTIPLLLSGCTESVKMNTELFRDRLCRLTGVIQSSDSIIVEGDSLDFSLSLPDGTNAFFRCREEKETGELVRVQLVFDKENIHTDSMKNLTDSTIILFAPGAEHEKLTGKLLPEGIGKTDFDVIRESDAFAEYSAVITKVGIGITVEKK